MKKLYMSDYSKGRISTAGIQENTVVHSHMSQGIHIHCVLSVSFIKILPLIYGYFFLIHLHVLPEHNNEWKQFHGT